MCAVQDSGHDYMDKADSAEGLRRPSIIIFGIEVTCEG